MSNELPLSGIRVLEIGGGCARRVRDALSRGLRRGRDSQRRSRWELGIHRLYQGADDKAHCLEDLCRATGIEAAHVAHVGDDVPDLPIFNRVGFRISVPGAHPVVAARADYVTDARAGAGAMREVCHLLMVAQDTWTRALARYDR